MTTEEEGPAGEAPPSRQAIAAAAPLNARRITAAASKLLAALASCVLSVGLCVAAVDRPVATFVHAHLGDRRFAWFSQTYNGHLLTVGPFSVMAGPAEAMGSLALLLFAGLGMAASAGWRPGRRGRIGFALCSSVFAAFAINAIAKSVFGRTWPESWLGDNPSFIRDGVYGFFPFHGGQPWGSFPSGHTTIITAPASILWFAWPELRGVWATIVALVIVGLLGANYHFVGDVVGGLYLGCAIGLATAELTLSPRDRFQSSR